MTKPMSQAARLVIAAALAFSLMLFIEQGSQVIERGQLFTSAKWTAYVVLLGGFVAMGRRLADVQRYAPLGKFRYKP
jgi:hypothetical protein